MLITAERQSHAIRMEYFRAIMRQEIGWFDEMSSGELTTRLSGLVTKLVLFITVHYSLFIKVVLTHISENGFKIVRSKLWRI